MTRAVFLDRDGVIIENKPDYIRSWSDVHFFPQALDALRVLSRSEYKILVITNQSPVGRGIVTLDTANQINDRIVQEVVANGGRIDGVYMCPHAPQDDCLCRKPRPGLLLEAAAGHSIDLPASILIGDAVTDLLAASEAGIRDAILVRTGRGEEQLRIAEEMGVSFTVYNDLRDAVVTRFLD